jgi:rubrerythrin
MFQNRNNLKVNNMKLRQYLKENFIGVNDIENIQEGIERDKQILRLSILAEIDAINLYKKFATLTNNEKLKNILSDIAEEENVHIGEFEGLLETIDKNWSKFKEDGKKEIHNI